MNKLNKKIEKFIEEHDMEFMGHFNREQHGNPRADREVDHYTIRSEFGIFLGRVEPSCSYEQFLETIALSAIVEAEKVAELLNYYEELSEDAYEDDDFAESGWL